MKKVVILAGGSGTRLWPLSRSTYPKQFIKLIEERSLFQNTITRNSKADFVVVTNEAHFFLVRDQASEVGETKLSCILEPVGRNTAPAIALACLNMDADDLVLVTPSDHYIKNTIEYQKVIQKAEELAKEGYLVTLGIKPEYPAIGYGYIEAKGSDVLSFKEKPDLKTAEKYVKKDNFFWNSGMFIFRAGTFLDELSKYSEEILSACNKANQHCENDDKNSVRRVREEDMLKIPANSIDYAILEKSDKVKVVTADIGWSDLGSFDELFNAIKKDKDNNAVIGQNILIDSSNNLIISRENKLITALGIKDTIIVETSDALLVAQRGHSEKVKEVVQILNTQKSTLAEAHLDVHRPWGTYTVLLEETGRYKIKQIVVKPKHKLSLQKHYHRNEHWIVVSGTARIQNGDKEYLVRENESTYIPMGQEHRLENPGKINLVMIEAQVGQYLQEDDIVRLEDDFNRN